MEGVNMAQEDGGHGEAAGNGEIDQSGRGRVADMEKELAREGADKATVISDWIEVWRERVRVMEEARGEERKWKKEREQMIKERKKDREEMEEERKAVNLKWKWRLKEQKCQWEQRMEEMVKKGA